MFPGLTVPKNNGERLLLRFENVCDGGESFDFSSSNAECNKSAWLEALVSKENASSDGMILKLVSSDGAIFFIRSIYLKTLTFHDFLARIFLDSGEFFESEIEDIFFAAEAFFAEKSALKSLERSEQSRFLLLRKLISKGGSRSACETALDFLEKQGLLDDFRFSAAWIRSHSISKAQGRTRLIQELRARGISKDIAEKAVTEHFENVDEIGECTRAAKMAKRRGKSGEKLLKYLVDAGFSYKMALAEVKNTHDL